MKDLLYIAGTLVFFALMVTYVAACDRLGRRGENATASEEQRS